MYNIYQCIYIYIYLSVIISLSQNRAPPHGKKSSRDIPFAGRHLRDDHEKCVCTSWIPGIRDVLVKAFLDDTDMASKIFQRFLLNHQASQLHVPVMTRVNHSTSPFTSGCWDPKLPETTNPNHTFIILLST